MRKTQSPVCSDKIFSWYWASAYDYHGVMALRFVPAYTNFSIRQGGL